jgi:hypothetical protein
LSFLYLISVPGGFNFQAEKEYYNDLPGKIPPDLLAEVNSKPDEPVIIISGRFSCEIR